MSNVQYTEVKAGADWDLGKLQKNSASFNEYLKSSVSRVAGTNRYYNRNLVKPITVYTGETFRIKVSIKKKANTDLTITYTVTAPDKSVCILVDNAAYKTAAEVNADLDEITADFAKIG